MNEIDKIRFARYYPDWKPNNTAGCNSSDDSGDESIENTGKLGYVENIKVDKDKLINSVIKGDKVDSDMAKDL